LPESFKVEKAAVGDIARLSEQVDEFARRGDMLPRAPAELFETLRDFFVVRHEGEVVGCAALHINWEDLAEVRSLAVRDESQSLGVGSLLVRACLDEARSLGLKRVFALTMKPAFFQKLGFSQADAMTLSRKVWSECYRCPKFMSCDETAMVLDI
jgi:N-acetylglutamate synthase and related acetyltransferases